MYKRRTNGGRIPARAQADVCVGAVIILMLPYDRNDGRNGAVDVAETKKDEMYKYDAGRCENR